MNTILPVENHDVLAALRGFLKRLLDENIIEAILVPLENDGSVTPALVTDSEMLKYANPLMPVNPINNARAVSAITGKHAPAKLGVVLRPCEIRALSNWSNFNKPHWIMYYSSAQIAPALVNWMSFLPITLQLDSGLLDEQALRNPSLVLPTGPQLVPSVCRKTIE